MSALAVGISGAVLAGCGSGTKTISEPASAAAPYGTRSGESSETASTSKTTTSSAKTSSTTSAAVSTTTITTTVARTQGAPAFTQQTSEPAATAAAVEVVKAHGYTPADVSQYRANQTLRVLIGTYTGSNDGHDQQAFFFLDGHYLGTDSSQPSATIRLVGQSETEVTLAYALYRPHDALCCPSGGEAKVTFQLDNGALTPLQPLPPASSTTGLSRN
jgi:cytoskeletal protein RodZ